MTYVTKYIETSLPIWFNPSQEKYIKSEEIIEILGEKFNSVTKQYN